jgi:hypothetical protein
MQPPKIKISAYKPIYSKLKNKMVPGCIPYDADLYEELYAIKNGSHKAIINDLRQIKDKDQRSDFKARNLKALTISCICKEWRKRDNVVEHTGLLNIDIDQTGNEDLRTKEDFESLRDTIAGLPTVVASFLSASGLGVTFIVKIKPEEHKKAFDSIKGELKANLNIEIDPNTYDVTRLRFISVDDGAYINPDFDSIKEYAPLDKYVKKRNSKPIQFVPTKDIDTVENFEYCLKTPEQEWKFEEGSKFYYLRSLAGKTNILGMSQEFVEQQVVERFGDKSGISDNALLEPIRSIYKTFPGQFGSYKPNGNGHQVNFWYFTEGKDGTEVVNISRYELIKFLKSKGYAKYYINEEKFVFVRVKNNILKPIQASHIQDFVLRYIENLPFKISENSTRNQLAEKLLKAVNVYFSENYLRSLPSLEIKSVKSSPDKAYFYYKNGVVVVSSHGIRVKEYQSIDWHVWESQIVDREVNIDENQEFEGCYFVDFMKLLSGVTNLEGTDDLDQENKDILAQKRFESLMTITGYLLHSYKDPADAKAIILLDQNDTDNPQGGTGKGLFSKAIALIKNAITIDGKNFTFDKSFAWQRISIDTQLVIFDDVSKYFPFERLFSILTEGWVVEKKNMGEIFIPFEQSPKVMILNNYVLSGEGDSHERRRVIFELNKFFNIERTPLTHFGHRFFYDWDEKQWNMFDHWMMYCVQYYLAAGKVQQTDLISVNLRKLDTGIPEEVQKFFQDFCESKTKDEFFSTADMMIELKSKYENFKKVSSTKFRDWVGIFNRYGLAGWHLEKGRNNNLRGYWLRAK